MAPTGQSASWSDVLCCRICSELFSSKKLPINLACGHTICHNCLNELNTSSCPLDQTAISIPFEKLPPNLALLSILSEFINTKPGIDQELSDEYRHIESNLVELASYLHPVECLFGGSVWSDELSRPMQRKLISLLCYQLMEYKGLKRALKTARALAERALSELIIYHQNNSNISTILWSAIRSRGCQFLGPAAMQEEILKLILLILSDGALMSRKTLVLYIVQTLREDYPQASKTCVGHVVQLLYRAGCFNVLKREGESSLMQLKTQFRHYDALRREHDAQIVQLHSTQDFEQQVRDLKTAIEQCSGRDMLIPTFEHFERFANFDYLSELPDWTLAVHLFDSLSIARFIPATKCPSVCHHGDHSYKTRFSRNYPNPKGTAAGSICSASVKSTCVLAKNEFRTSIPQIQSHPLPVFIEPMPAVSLPTVLQSHLTEFPLFSTNTSSLDLSSAVGNNVNLVRNLTPVAQPLSTPATPLVPLMMQAVNHFLSPPLFPVATLAQVICDSCVQDIYASENNGMNGEQLVLPK
uniref:RING-type E3 ubiquitin transferase n=1 Tax=Wuchereria bancrofti TaxID=6293 RepID=A0A1I8EA41_WUCBA